MMKEFAILTLGCKVNQYESQQVRQWLERHGLTQVDIAASPDVVVVNTCCVTHTASAKSRHLIAQAQRHHPDAIIVCGCLPAVDTDELEIAGENVHVVKDRTDLTTTLNLLAGVKSTTPESETPRHPRDTRIKADFDLKVKPKQDLDSSVELAPLTCFPGRTRAFLKIQDGCDSFCSYCIIPLARPRVHSRGAAEILAEAEALIAAGHKEIVITGVHIGAYGHASVRRRDANSENAHLPALLADLAQVPGLARIRLSSLDPADVTTDLLDVCAANRNIMPHLHLSLQSGSDAVLRRMGRPYTADEFRAKVELIRSRLDRPALTTDIIVGFPGETDADFEQTFALARDVGFAKTHVFAFSPRKGTAAARMADKVPSQVAKERSRTLRALDQQLQIRFRAQFLGETAQVLIETTDPAASGRAERYFPVHVASNGPLKPDKNDLVTVTLIENTPTGVLGELVTQ
ncbi:MAG: tRNA (N(6)-L-threonylcarbamoyladenosine(37)-C(2))-methylthiotransferase MtaB [Sedimentisphaerales bacterium]|nr:tRNA (N(6)-L-threonylcarbamoyladenosine(37)-C(2))-methylthiotransferase MtaB [Sedimentisphaerales bacterium]